MQRPVAILGALTALLAGPATAQTLESRVPGLAIAALADLPAAPTGQGDREFCSHKLVESPQTAAALLVEARGWGVTAEVPVGDLTAISFVGGFVQGTSGSCELRDGNLGIFRGDRLVALVYSTDPEAVLPGFAAPFGENGLRLWSGDYLAAPLADITASALAVTVLPLAASEPVCNGTALVPLIYGLPIDQARDLLAKAGWQPVPAARSQVQVYSIADDLAAAGVPEVEECSGTGFGYCAYRYSGPAGELGVTTVGEIAEDGTLPAVADYGVNCR